MADYITHSPDIVLAFSSPEYRAGHPVSIVGFDLSGKSPRPIYYPSIPKGAKLFRNAPGGWKEVDQESGLLIGAETFIGPKWEA